MKCEDMARRALDAMDRLNKKHCQEELERIKNNIYPDTIIDCSNCQFAKPDPTTAFLMELAELLHKYDAKITQNYGCFDVALNGKWVHTIEGGDEYALTSDNIFDYEKE